MEGTILSFFSVAMPVHVKATSEDGCRDWRTVYLDTPRLPNPIIGGLWDPVSGTPLYERSGLSSFTEAWPRSAPCDRRLA
jgi:hypothetical protein